MIDFIIPKPEDMVQSLEEQRVYLRERLDSLVTLIQKLTVTRQTGENPPTEVELVTAAQDCLGITLQMENFCNGILSYVPGKIDMPKTSEAAEIQKLLKMPVQGKPA